MLTTHSIGDIMAAKNTTQWIVEPLIAVGGITELTGHAKESGKSTMVLALCRAIVMGEEFLGKPTLSTKILIMSEQNPWTVKPALERCRIPKGAPIEHVFWYDHAGADWEDLMDDVIDHVEAHEIGLVVVDTLGAFALNRAESENDASAQIMAMRPLQALAALGAGVMIVRHERKSGGRPGVSGRGSGAITGAVDIVYTLRKSKGNKRTLYGMGRLEGLYEKLLIEWTPEDGYSTATTADEIADKIKDALPATATDIATAISMPRSTVQRWLTANGIPSKPDGRKKVYYKSA